VQWFCSTIALIDVNGVEYVANAELFGQYFGDEVEFPLSMRIKHENLTILSTVLY